MPLSELMNDIAMCAHTEYPLPAVSLLQREFDLLPGSKSSLNRLLSLEPDSGLPAKIRKIKVLQAPREVVK